MQGFRAAYGGDSGSLGNFTGTLSNGGERVTLSDSKGNTIDSVKYGDRSPWPVGADGYSASLERICPSAKDCWKSTHSGVGDMLRRGVDQAAVRFDFGWAEQIASNPLPRVELFDRSAEAYFAQVVLSRFLGRPRGILAAVSGVIGAC